MPYFARAPRCPGPKPEAEKFFASLDAGLVHVASDVEGAITHVKALLAAQATEAAAQ